MSLRERTRPGTGIIFVTDRSNLLLNRRSLPDAQFGGIGIPSQWDNRGDGYPVDRCDAYRHSAAQCVELARTINSPRDRAVLLEMAVVWSRLAEYAAKTVARKERAELEWPASVDGNVQHTG